MSHFKVDLSREVSLQIENNGVSITRTKFEIFVSENKEFRFNFFSYIDISFFQIDETFYPQTTFHL